MANTGKESEKERRLLFLIILCAAAVLRIYIVTLDMNILLDQGLVQDDAYYYYVIARHILEHGLSSFDGINLTNGYHPLWQAISLPVFYCFDGDLAVRIMLAIASLFDLLSLIVFYKILRRVLKNHYVVLIGMIILAFHGTIIRTWFNGIETALSVFSLLWLLHQLLLIKDSHTSALKDHIWLGVIAAFSFLSRTDNAIIIMAIFLFLYLPPLFSNKEYKCGLVASAIFAALISPWLAWNIVNFGSIVQISGQMRGGTWLIDGPPAELSLPQALIYSAVSSLTSIRIVFEKMFAPAFLPVLSGYTYFAFFLLSAIYICLKYPACKRNFYLFFPFMAGVIALFLYHAGVRHFVRGWYNAPVLLMLTLTFCFLLDEIKTKTFENLHRNIFFIILAILIIFYSPGNYTKRPDNLHLDNRLAIAAWINLNTSPDAIIGAANAGIMGYYTKRSVINLDGVVNEQAFHARIANQLQRYIRDAGIDYLADHKGTLTLLCRPNSYYNCTRVDNLGTSTQVMRISD
jgi:hypothetical protein